MNDLSGELLFADRRSHWRSAAAHVKPNGTATCRVIHVHWWRQLEGDQEVTTKTLRCAVFWDTTQRWVVMPYRRFGTISTVFKGQEIQEKGFLDFLKMGRIGRPETSVRNIPQELRSHLRRDGSLNWRKTFSVSLRILSLQV